MAEGSRVQRPALILSFNALCDTVGRNGLAPARFTFLINEHVCATAEKAKHPASEKFFIPSGTRSYVTSARAARTEFRHDSCNTEHR